MRRCRLLYVCMMVAYEASKACNPRPGSAAVATKTTLSHTDSGHTFQDEKMCKPDSPTIPLPTSQAIQSPRGISVECVVAVLLPLTERWVEQAVSLCLTPSHNSSIGGIRHMCQLKDYRERGPSLARRRLPTVVPLACFLTRCCLSLTCASRLRPDLP